MCDMGWLLKVPVGIVPMDHISQNQVARIRELARMGGMSLEHIYVKQELSPDSELGWDNVAYVELSVPELTLYPNIFLLNATISYLVVEIRNALGCEVSKNSLEQAVKWFDRFRTNGAESGV